MSFGFRKLICVDKLSWLFGFFFGYEYKDLVDVEMCVAKCSYFWGENGYHMSTLSLQHEKSRTVVLSYQNNLVVKECFGLAFIYYRYFCLSDKFSFCFQRVIAVHSSDQQTHPFNSDTENASINSKVNILHKLKASIFPCKFYIICIGHNL